LVEPIIHLSYASEKGAKDVNSKSLKLMDKKFRKLIDLFLCDGGYKVISLSHPLESSLNFKLQSLSSTNFFMRDTLRNNQLIKMLCSSTLGDLKVALSDQFPVSENTRLIDIFAPILEVIGAYSIQYKSGIVLTGPDLHRFWLWTFQSLELPKETVALCCLPHLTDRNIRIFQSSHTKSELITLFENEELSNSDLIQILVFLYLFVPTKLSDPYLLKDVAELLSPKNTELKMEQILESLKKNRGVKKPPAIFRDILNKAGVTHEH
jgi:hypothetical protein